MRREQRVGTPDCHPVVAYSHVIGGESTLQNGSRVVLVALQTAKRAPRRASGFDRRPIDVPPPLAARNHERDHRGERCDLEIMTSTSDAERITPRWSTISVSRSEWAPGPERGRRDPCSTDQARPPYAPLTPSQSTHRDHSRIGRDSRLRWPGRPASAGKGVKGRPGDQFVLAPHEIGKPGWNDRAPDVGWIGTY